MDPLEISYRAYHSAFKKMYPVSNIELDEKGIKAVRIYNGPHTIPLYSNYNRANDALNLLKLMPSIPFYRSKDNNRIYDGDIVKYEDSIYTNLLVVKWMDKYGCFVLEEINIPSSIVPVPIPTLTILNQHNLSKVTVMGNIYENPELLNSTTEQNK